VGLREERAGGAGGGASPEPAKAPVYIISTDCMNCGLCEFMCHAGAIIEAKRQFIILKHRCDGCGDCVSSCMVQAIVPRDAFRDRQAHTLAAALKDVLGESP
jgi:ferredoxin